jgi:ADP-ribosyl-[dinitrogen reductase] hydrolase
MRVLPVALATLGQGEDAVRAAVRAQAHVTHNNPDSDAASEFLALAVQEGLRGGALRDVYRRGIEPFVQVRPHFTYRTRRRENPSGWVVETVQAVLQSLMTTDTFEKCLIDVVNRGGDADTTGAIAGMLAGAIYGRDALPARWLKALDPAARDACTTQARKLVALTSA